jgi:hypothetical protein
LHRFSSLLAARSFGRRSTRAAVDGAPHRPGPRRLLLFVLAVGFIAGLTFDAVYATLRNQDVADTSSHCPDRLSVISIADNTGP